MPSGFRFNGPVGKRGSSSEGGRVLSYGLRVVSGVGLKKAAAVGRTMSTRGCMIRVERLGGKILVLGNDTLCFLVNTLCSWVWLSGAGGGGAVGAVRSVGAGRGTYWRVAGAKAGVVMGAPRGLRSGSVGGGLTYRKPFSVQTEKTKRKERAVEDAIEKNYGFGVIVFAKNIPLRFNIEKIYGSG